MKTLNNTQTEQIFEFLNGLNIENVTITDYVNIEDIDFENAYNSILDILDDNGGFNIEIIYYGSAMDYLKENDPSLKESLGLAHEMGFSADSLSSEILASLLASENARTEFYELDSEINDFFQNMYDEQLCEE
jgi:hypothetical protein